MANLIRVREAQRFYIPMFLSDVEIVIKKIIYYFFLTISWADFCLQEILIYMWLCAGKNLVYARVCGTAQMHCLQQ